MYDIGGIGGYRGYSVYRVYSVRSSSLTVGANSIPVTRSSIIKRAINPIPSTINTIVNTSNAEVPRFAHTQSIVYASKIDEAATIAGSPCMSVRSVSAVHEHIEAARVTKPWCSSSQVDLKG